MHVMWQAHLALNQCSGLRDKKPLMITLIKKGSHADKRSKELRTHPTPVGDVQAPSYQASVITMMKEGSS